MRTSELEKREWQFKRHSLGSMVSEAENDADNGQCRSTAKRQPARVRH